MSHWVQIPAKRVGIFLIFKKITFKKNSIMTKTLSDQSKCCLHLFLCCDSLYETWKPQSLWHSSCKWPIKTEQECIEHIHVVNELYSYLGQIHTLSKHPHGGHGHLQSHVTSQVRQPAGSQWDKIFHTHLELNQRSPSGQVSALSITPTLLVKVKGVKVCAHQCMFNHLPVDNQHWILLLYEKAG